MFIDGRGKPTRARRPEAERDAAAEVAQAKRWKRGIGKKEEREKGKEAGEVGKRKGWREKKWLARAPRERDPGLARHRRPDDQRARHEVRHTGATDSGPRPSGCDDRSER